MSETKGLFPSPRRVDDWMRKHPGTLAISWGPWGGFYVVRGLATSRLCLGWLAITRVNVEVEDLMRAYADQENIVAW